MAKRKNYYKYTNINKLREQISLQIEVITQLTELGTWHTFNDQINKLRIMVREYKRKLNISCSADPLEGRSSKLKNASCKNPLKS